MQTPNAERVSERHCGWSLWPPRKILQVSVSSHATVSYPFLSRHYLVSLFVRLGFSFIKCDIFCNNSERRKMSRNVTPRSASPRSRLPENVPPPPARGHRSLLALRPGGSHVLIVGNMQQRRTDEGVKSLPQLGPEPPDVAVWPAGDNEPWLSSFLEGRLFAHCSRGRGGVS